MRIGIDGLVLRGRDAGSLRYFELLLAALRSSTGGNEYIVFTDEQVIQAGKLPKGERLQYQGVRSSPVLPRAVQQQLFSGWHSRGKLDLLHATVFVPPLGYPGKTLMTVFDLTYLLYPQTQKWTGRTWWRLLGKAGIRKATRLMALSASTKADLVKFAGIPPEKVDVIPPYLPPGFAPCQNVPEVREKYNLPGEYILFVGTLERRKQVASLVRAYARARRDGKLTHKLVLAGSPGWYFQDITRAIAETGAESEILLTGYIPEEDLPGIYGGASLFVYLSIYEGFGFPVLEAMACGVPVLASNRSSIPEIVQDAGIMVAPEDIEQASRIMVEILTDRGLRDRLIERGLQVSRSFSESAFTAKILSCYQEIAQSS